VCSADFGESRMSWLAFFAVGWGLPLSFYCAVQTAAIWSLRGRWRVAVAAPIPLMVVVAGHMAWAYSQNSNLWPMTMLMTAPGAAVAVLAMWITGLAIDRRWKMLMLPAGLTSGAAFAARSGDHGISLLWGGEVVPFAAALVAGGAVAAGVVAAIARRRNWPAPA
jgi:hypothetical protein